MIYRFSFYITAFLSCLMGYWLQAQPAANDLTHLGNGVAAIVEGEIITIQQLRKELEPILPRLQVEAKNKKDFAQRVDTLTYEILQTMIDRILIVNAGKEKGILIPDSYIDKEYDKALEQDFGDNRAQFLEYLKTQGLTPREYRKIIYDRVVVNVMRQENRKSESEVSPERIEAFYIANKARFYQSEAIHLRQIILTNSAGTDSTALQARATEIMDKLQQGARFSDLAREYGQDAVSRKGGDWGWIERKDIRTELSDVAFSLEPGQYSQPIEISNAVFILYAEAVRKEMIQPIAQVRDFIERQLSDQIARENQAMWLQSLRDSAFVRYYL